MPSFTDFLVVIGMIGLRFGVPALVLAGLAYGLKRLDRRWEAEARDYAARHPEAREVVQPTAPQPAAPRPTAPARTPARTPSVPFVPPPEKERRIQPGVSAGQPGIAVPGQRGGVYPGQPGLSAAPQRPCWDLKSCSETAKAQCAAPQHPDQPCWQARFDAEGQIPEECVQCDVFQRYPMM